MEIALSHTVTTSASLESIFKAETECHLILESGLQWREREATIKCAVEDTV